MWHKKVEIHALHQLTIDGGLPSLALWLSKNSEQIGKKKKWCRGNTKRDIWSSKSRKTTGTIFLYTAFVRGGRPTGCA
ncbi:MAG: hypothetical protein SOX83_04370 [Sodaliphilus sp.]|nr:hypothetical protein [Sodaliphilus sp.]